MKEKGKQWRLAGSLIGLSILAGSAAGAATMAQQCVIADKVCFVMRASDGPLSPEQRIDRVNDRLAYILGHESLRPGSVQAVPLANGDAKIRVGRSLLTNVTRADAVANGAPSPQALALIWVSNLRTALPQAEPKVWPLRSRLARHSARRHRWGARKTIGALRSRRSAATS
jgi:hypothetical protein